MLIREAAVAGSFYPADKHQLTQILQQLFTDMKQNSNIDHSKIPKALILPHAGYIYSGVVAAAGYQLVMPQAEQINRVVILGPSHRVAFHGIALPESEYFATPLGDIVVDPFAYEMLQHMPFVFQSAKAHLMEHSIEVHLPFLQSILRHFSIIPMLVGDATAEEVIAVLDAYFGQAGVLIIISTDLSHFKNYHQALEIDKQTSDLISDKYYRIKAEQACGCRPLNGLLKYADQHNLQVKQLALCNSGDTAGGKSSVVGYGAYAIY